MKQSLAENDTANPTAQASGLLWFDEDVAAIKKSLPIGESDRIKLLADSRAEFYQALIGFYFQIKYSTSTIFAILAGTFAILNFSPLSQGKSTALLSALTPVGLLLGAAVCIFFLVAAGGQYALYVPAVIFSAKLHFACGITGHLWFEGARISQNLRRPVVTTS